MKFAAPSGKYKAKQGRAVKAKGKVKLRSIALGGKLTKKVAITLKKRKLHRGKPLKVSFTLIRDGKPLAARTVPVRLDFGQTKANKRR